MSALVNDVVAYLFPIATLYSCYITIATWSSHMMCTLHLTYGAGTALVNDVVAQLLPGPHESPSQSGGRLVGLHPERATGPVELI